MPHRPRSPVLLLVALGLVLAVPGATAAPGDHLPTVEKVARVFPHLAGGTRTVGDAGDYDTLPAKKCLDPKVLGEPRRSTYATYVMSDGQRPYEAGLDEPYTAVYWFEDEPAAHAVMRKIKRFLRRCEGTQDLGQVHHSVLRLPGPGISDRSVAFRTSTAYFETYFRSINRAWVVVQRGRRIVEAAVLRAQTEPEVELAVRLARLTLRSSR